MAKISITGLKARDKAIKGMNYVGDAIKSTIGPFGLNFLLEKENKITNDGYNISTALCPTIKDEFERRGALVAHEASAKTNELVGDFTSGAWALTTEIVKEATRYLPNEKSIKAKKTPADIIQWITKSKDEVINMLTEMAVAIDSEEALIKSALVSCEDREMAELIGKMQWNLGPNGVIVAEEVNDVKSSIEKVNGIKLDNGFSTSGIITNQEKQSLELSDTSILLTNYVIDKKELLTLKDKVFLPLVNQKKLGIIIVGRAFTQEAVKFCMENINSGFAIFPINAPYTNQADVMRDMQAIVGGRCINNEEVSFDDISIEDVGFAKRIVAKQHNSIIAGLEDEKAKVRIEARVNELQEKLKGEESVFMKSMIESRIAQLTGGFAILKVGSTSLVNRKRLKDKADDAVNAVRLALKGGVVKGAGLAFKEISEKLSDENILKKPLTCINDQIILSSPEGWVIEDWVKDPLLVLKCGLEQSCEFAGTFATVNGQVVEENPKVCSCSGNSNEINMDTEI